MPPPKFDPADLDWSRHLLSPAEVELGEGVFLADVARKLGEAIFDTWDGNTAQDLRPDPYPGVTILDPDLAFDEQGGQIAEIHSAFGPAVRATLGPAAWRDVRLRLQDREAWLRSHVADPEGGPPISADALAARKGEDGTDPIDQDNWQFAWENVELERDFRRAAAERMTIIATAVAKLAIGGNIRLRARPIDGGPTDVEVPLSIWSGPAETRLRRLASCGFDPSAPADASAEPTHLMFAAEHGLDEAVARYGRENHVPVEIPDEAGFAPAKPKRRIRQDDDETRVEQFLLAIIGQHGKPNWRGIDLECLVQKAFGSYMEGTVRRVRRRLGRMDGLEHLVTPGQPPKGPRPSEMSDREITRLVTDFMNDNRDRTA